ncbi:MAG: hypothetical protein R2849_18880 [Thermomicrobiales bacterium]
MSETSSFRRLNLTGWLAAAAARHAWTTVAIWLAVFLIGAGLIRWAG